MGEPTQKKKRVRIKVRAEDADDLAAVFKANLSPKGVFIKTSEELTTGQPVEVEILFSSGERALFGTGAVSYVGRRTGAAVGVSFDLEWDAPSVELVKSVLTRPTVPPASFEPIGVGDATEPERASPPRPSEPIAEIALESLAPPPMDDEDRQTTVKTQGVGDPDDTEDEPDATEETPVPEIALATSSEEAEDTEDGVVSVPPPALDAPDALEASPEPVTAEAAPEDPSLADEEATPEPESSPISEDAAPRDSVPAELAEEFFADGDGVEAQPRASMDEVTGGDEADTEADAPKKGVWRWIKKRFGSTASGPPPGSEEAEAEDGS